jgi:DNA-binding transcriptional ArsR family regulator
MRDVQARSQLLPILRTPLIGDLLAWLYLHPDEAFTATDLAVRFHVSQSTVSREADRLADTGLVLEERRGGLRLLRANLDTPLTGPLTDLLALTYGPVAVLGDLLAAVPGVAEAYIYGSWAARYRGEAGPVPRDVDVLVVGDADEDELFDSARAAERRLGREVSIHRVAAKQWHSPGRDPFLASVRSRPLVPVPLRSDKP